MFRSLSSSLITLFIVIMAGFMLLFISKGSSDIAFSRVAMSGDVSNAEYLAEIRKKERQAVELAENTMPDEDGGDEPEPEPVAGDGPKVVLWISIPGFRGDYIEKTENTEFFDRMVNEGSSTQEMKPNFPCLTFPAHVSLATGTTADKHGIPMDRFRMEDGSIVDSPTDEGLMRAEPIWTTATRQGIRTLVHDWPLSQKPGGTPPAYFLDSFDPAATDQQRLDALWDAWTNDSDENKLRLLMVRLTGLQDAAMTNGALEDATFDAIAALDKTLAEFFKKVEEKWADLAPEDGGLAVIVTTDHGLANRDKNINLPQLLGDDLLKHLDVVAHDGVGHLFFKDLPESAAQRKLLVENLDKELSSRTYFRGYFPPGAPEGFGTVSALPENWIYNVEGRTGDRIISLRSGYSFSDATFSEPVFEPGEAGGKFAAFGYPVESSTRMAGQAIIWGYPESPASGSLGEIDFLKFHATVCKLLGIEPAESAGKDALPVD